MPGFYVWLLAHLCTPTYSHCLFPGTTRTEASRIRAESGMSEQQAGFGHRDPEA